MASNPASLIFVDRNVNCRTFAILVHPAKPVPVMGVFSRLGFCNPVKPAMASSPSSLSAVDLNTTLARFGISFQVANPVPVTLVPERSTVRMFLRPAR